MMNNNLNNWLKLINKKQLAPIMPDECVEYLNNAINLFKNPSPLNEYKLSKANSLIEDMAMEVSLMLFDDEVSLDVRLEFIDSCYLLFKDWFDLQKDYSDYCFMFWDALIGRPCKAESLSDNQKAIIDSIFECLKKLIKIDNKWCQLSALHGFNHLKDDRSKPLILNFINNCSDEEMVEYAQKALIYKEL